MTVHKAQGMMLARVTVDSANSFEQGQAYIALSWAKTLAGLRVLSLPRYHRGTNEEVDRFFLKNGLVDENSDIKPTKKSS